MLGTSTELLFCTIFLGANDAALPGERQHVPIDEYEANLGTIITSIRCVLVLV
jgi:isoamyl acetate esterase